MAGTDVKEIILRVNGTDAQKKIDDLTRRIQHAQQERQRLEQAHSSGQPWTQKETRAMQTYSKEIETCTRRLNRMQATGDEVGRTLRNMSSAGINDLKRAIQSMERTLNSGRIARGSKEWETLTGSIRQCRTELEKLQAERRSMESRWEKLNRLFNDWAGSIAAPTAALTGVIMAGRSAVKAYVEMDEELAQVTKFTGLSKKELEELQEEFKKMDTRSSRIELNKLAEEAGRLGKTSVEDVLGFVKAADVINVALDDLGDGATLTLSKLTNIFGDEERLGTEKALLSVGSVINELSQNCTASAPYLANFAQRLAGVGAQAKMTIPQIMAFGAVLDSQGQACEMSATAFSELTMRLFKEPEKIAKATGIPLQTLNEELKKSTADGLMLLLNRLHELGSIDVLAPLLKEMGENGTRASGVIAALAGNVDTLKWQLGEAQKAYDDGTSVTKEFAVQNNTLQAGLDKAKKRLNEIAIDLGQKFMPVMTHVVSSTSLLLKAVSALVTFFIKYRVTIATVTAAFVAYKIAVEAANIAFKVHYAWLVVVNAAQKVGTAVMATYKTAVLACTVAYNKMTGNIERAAAAQRLMNTTMKANVYALAAAAIAALVVQIYNHTKALTSEEKAEKAVTNVRTEAIKKVQEEKINLETLRAAAMDEKLSLDERKTAIDKLNKVVPNYNAFLDKTTGKYHENKAALDDYINSLIRQYEIMGAKDKLAEIGRQKAELKIEQAKARRDLENANKKNTAIQNTNQASYSGSITGITLGQTTNIAHDVETGSIERRIRKIGAQFNDLVAEENLILEIWGNDMKKEAVKPPTHSDAPTYDANAPGTGSGSGKSESSHSGNSTSDKADKKEEERIKNELARIKALQQQKETLALTEYMTGKTDYKTYQEELMKIDAWSILERQKLYKEGSNEWIELEHERVEKMQTALEKHHAWSIEELKRRQAAELRAEKESYAAGAYTKEVHEETVKQIQLRHLKDRVELLKSLNMDYYEAEQEYNDAVVEDQIEKREKLVEKMEELRKKYMEKEKVTKESEIKAAEELALKLGWTEEEKQKLIAAIRKKYDENAKKEEKELLDSIAGPTDEITSAFLSIGDAFADMQKRIAEGGKATWEDYARMAMGALNMVMATMSAASNLMQANSDLEVAKIEKRYETEIEAAGKNRKKVEALEKQKEEEIAKVKSEHQRKATKIQIAQAVAQTAMAAISAYASAASIPVIGWIIAPIAAALATAAGAIQITTIKKQAQAQALGYEKGGFTGGNRYRKEAGIVHEGEFVANHDAVNNRELLPLLETIDRAQRNNTVASLTAKDVSASLPASNSSSANTTTVIVRDDAETKAAVGQLTEVLAEGIDARVIIDGPNGLDKQWRRYNQMKGRK